MIADKQLSEKQVKWMLVGSFAAGALALAVVAGIALAQDANENSEGKRVYDHWCSHCHDSGQGHPGTQGLQIKYRDTGIPAVLLERTDLTPPVIETFVRQGVLAMAPFRKTEITDAELAALAAYLSD
jgi:mono/diheme cytochrome c family protein